MRYLFLLFPLFLLFVSCGQNSSSASAKGVNKDASTDGVISVEQFKQGITDLAAIQLVDVRTPEEFAKGYIEGAINLNFYDENFDAQIDQLDREKPVYLYCRSGNRSGKTYNKMKQKGFSQVFDLGVGYKGWPYK